MLDRVDALIQELREVDGLLGDPQVIGDRERLVDLSRRRKALEPVVAVGEELRRVRDDLVVAREAAATAEGEERSAWRSEVEELSARGDALEAELRLLLLPPDPFAGRNVIVEIRGAEGGEEANLFARDLHDMYLAWAARQGWGVEELSSTPSDLGGLAEVTFLLRGDDVWTHMRHEAGPHRVQRVPVTESQGRVHTSSATVSVLPEAEEVDLEIDPADLQVDVYRSSGPGGQSVNTTDSAVRVTHRPSGLVVAMQDEKSQLQNKAKALRVLRSRLLRLEEERRQAESSDARRAQIGGGGRSEKIRTYNFKENRVTDHRIGLTLYQLDKVLAGELDELSGALVADERARQLAEHAPS